MWFCIPEKSGISIPVGARLTIDQKRAGEMIKRQLQFYVAVIAVALAAGCAPEGPVAQDDISRAESVVDSNSRPAADRNDDLMRKPANVLAFAAIKPGMTVFEIEAGEGYYTELFSALVGPDGAVIMQSPESFDSFLADAIESRLANNRLPNVRLTKTNFDELDAADSSIDIATWLLGPHELYFTPNGGSSLGDVEKAYAEIFRILKPGGVLIILDHAAALGSPETTGGALHRIDPAIVKQLAAGAGLMLIEESDVLRNPDDDYSMGVFDPAVRRKTDRFLLKYYKPE